MSDAALSSPTPWRRPDRGADRLVVATWLALLVLAVPLLRHAPQPVAPHIEPQIVVQAPPQIETVEVAATPPAAPVGPDFVPWTPPAPVSLPEGMSRWSPPLRPRSGGFYTRLTRPLEDSIFKASNHGNAGGFYGGDWLPENIDTRSGGAFLEVKREQHGGLPYTAAEMQSEEFYQYGRYEAVMQPARGSGLVTAFFTFTGRPFGAPHDEIDIEFLGSDTTKIHFNYFKNGKSIKPATFDLPFDAASAPHLYAFEWRPDGVTWFVDGEPMYATETGDPSIPVAPGKVMFSAWTGNPQMSGWHGKPVFRDGAGAQFNCVSFTPMGHDTPKCSDHHGAGAAALAVSAR